MRMASRRALLSLAGFASLAAPGSRSWAIACALSVLGCREESSDIEPDRVVAEFITRMQRVHGDRKAARAAYELLWSDARRNAAHPHGAIHFANTDLSGVALCEEALHHGVRAAEEVIGALEISSGTWR